MTIEKQMQSVLLDKTIKHLEMSQKFLNDNVLGLYVEIPVPNPRVYCSSEKHDIFSNREYLLPDYINKQEIIDFIKEKYEMKLTEYKKYYDEL